MELGEPKSRLGCEPCCLSLIQSVCLNKELYLVPEPFFQREL